MGAGERAGLEARLAQLKAISENAATPGGFDTTVHALGDSDPRIRRAAAWTLGALRDLRGRALLETALQDPDGPVRGTAAESLGAMALPRSREPLEAALRDPEPRVRAQACWALWAIHDPASRVALVPLLGDPDPSVRWSAVSAIGRFPTEAAFPRSPTPSPTRTTGSAARRSSVSAASTTPGSR